jgi:predicted nucleotidyltransferase
MRIGEVDFPDQQIEALCRRWRIRSLAVFGSTARSTSNPDSDVDFLVTYSPDARWTLLDEIALQDELAALLHRPVDLVSRRAVDASENWLRRESILKSARTIYAAAD